MRDVLRAVGVFVMAAMLATGASADTIYMKNGSVIRGTVIGYGNGEFSVQMTGGGGSRSRATLAGDDIDRIEFDGTGDGASSGGFDPQPRNDSGGGAGGGSSLPNDSGSPDDLGASTDPGGSGGRGASQPPLAGGGSNSGGRNEAATPVSGRREVTVPVEPKSDWTNTQLLLRRGARVRITATGTVKLDASGRRTAGPAGTDLADRDKLMPSRPTGALIAVIGDDNDDFVFVGAQAEFVAQRDGFLFLSVNEGMLKDNSGSFSARIVVEAGQPSASAPPPRTTGGGGGAPSSRNTQPPASRVDPQPSPQPARDNPPPSTAPARTDVPTSPAAGSAVREIDVVVQSNIDWTNTKVRVQRGNVVRVSATGTVTLKPGGGRTGPAGIETSDPGKLIPNGPTGGLIAVVGDDNDDFIYLGASGQFTSRHDGVLFLSVNEGNLRDNVGTFSARVAVEQVRVEGPAAGGGGGAPPRTAPAGGSSGGGGAATPAPKPAAPAIGANGGSAELTIQAKNDWTGTQIAIKKGMKVKITASGTVKLDRAGRISVSPAGNDTSDPLKLIADKPTGALLAVIGDDNSEYIFIGTGTEFVAERDGILYLGINEGEVADNSGAFIVRVVVTR